MILRLSWSCSWILIHSMTRYMRRHRSNYVLHCPCHSLQPQSRMIFAITVCYKLWVQLTTRPFKCVIVDLNEQKVLHKSVHPFTGKWEQELGQASGEVFEHLKVGDSVQVLPYLFPRQSDYLIRKKGDGEEERVYADCLEGKKYVIIFTFCLPVSDTNGDSNLCHDLQDVFPELLAEGRHDFEVVLVSRMDSEFPDYDDDLVAQEAFTHFFSAFPVSFLAVPILDSDRSDNLFRVMGSIDYPSTMCTVVDLEVGQVSHTRFNSFKYYGADFYPFTDERERELNHETEVIISSGKMPLTSLLRYQSSDVVLDCVHHDGSTCGKQQSLSSLTNKVVGLYLVRDGDDMGKVLDLYKNCKENNLEIEIVLVCEKRGGRRADLYTNPSLWEDYVHSLLQNPDCCGWLRLPFDDRVCRRLKLLCEFCGGDRLIIVGPNASYIDPYGMEVFREYGFGVEYFPFTKQAIWDSHVARLRGLRLEEVFTSVGIHDLISPDGQSASVSSVVRDTDILLYFGCAPLSEKPCWTGYLLEWYCEIKESAGERRCEMIFVCAPVPKEDGSLRCLNDCRTGKPWYTVPHCREACLKMFQKVIGRLSVSGDISTGLVAFGSDGRLRCPAVEDLLLDKSRPATFPESDDNLRMDVGRLLSYNPLGHWFEGFNIHDYE